MIITDELTVAKYPNTYNHITFEDLKIRFSFVHNNRTRRLLWKDQVRLFKRNSQRLKWTDKWTCREHEREADGRQLVSQRTVDEADDGSSPEGRRKIADGVWRWRTNFLGRGTKKRKLFSKYRHLSGSRKTLPRLFQILVEPFLGFLRAFITDQESNQASLQLLQSLTSITVVREVMNETRYAATKGTNKD